MFLYTNKHKIPFEIDEEDYETVSRHTWCIDDAGYPCTDRKLIGFSTIRIHELIMGPLPYGKIYDHINRHKWDNRKENIRAVTQVINQRNRKLNSNNTTGCLGVCITRSGGFCARIRTPGNQIYLGTFKTLEEAVAARKSAELKYWGNER